MIMKKVVSAMAIAGVLAAGGTAMAASNSQVQAEGSDSTKTTVETQNQYQKGVKDQGKDNTVEQVMNQFKHMYKNGDCTQDKTQTQKQNCDGSCDQNQTQTQSQTGK
jgi:Ni/Co efflux regulator RcnB